jgi:LacI family transcriptional regulator
MEMGIGTPEDISIMGIGDFAGSADMFPALSTVRIPAHAIVSQAGRHLIDCVADAEPERIVSIL